ncbi:hypothetical protein Tco_0646601 [Tanacetum coccineum]
MESARERIRITSGPPRSPNPNVTEGESSAQKSSTMIKLYTIQLSITEKKSRDYLETEQNVEKVKKHLAAEEIEKMVEEMARMSLLNFSI